MSHHGGDERDEPTVIGEFAGVDAPTIGQPSVPLPPPPGHTAAPLPPPPGQPAAPLPPPPGHRNGSTAGKVMLVLAGVLALAIAIGAVVVVVRPNDDDVRTDGSTTTAAPDDSGPDGPSTSAPPTTPVTPPTLPTATTTAPTTPIGPTPGTPARGSYVAMLWSDLLPNAPPDVVQRMLAEKQSQYGVTTAVVYGNDYLSLKDGTVGVVYAGGFDSPRAAAQWCRDRGERDLGCFGVGLNDQYTPEDRNGTGRMYVTEL